MRFEGLAATPRGWDVRWRKALRFSALRGTGGDTEGVGREVAEGASLFRPTGG